MTTPPTIFPSIPGSTPTRTCRKLIMSSLFSQIVAEEIPAGASIRSCESISLVTSALICSIASWVSSMLTPFYFEKKKLARTRDTIIVDGSVQCFILLFPRVTEVELIGSRSHSKSTCTPFARIGTEFNSQLPASTSRFRSTTRYTDVRTVGRRCDRSQSCRSVR